MTGAYTFKKFTPKDPAEDYWDTPRGHWCAWDGNSLKPGGEKVPQVFVLICCPECGEAGMLPHRIDAQGGVHPSIVCTGKGCTFHTMPNTLEGWDRVERQDTKDA